MYDPTRKDLRYSLQAYVEVKERVSSILSNLEAKIDPFEDEIDNLYDHYEINGLPLPVLDTNLAKILEQYQNTIIGSINSKYPLLLLPSDTELREIGVKPPFGIGFAVVGYGIYSPFNYHFPGFGVGLDNCYDQIKDLGLAKFSPKLVSRKWKAGLEELRI